MRVAGSGIPGRSADDVRQHDEWYSEYLMLKDSKKKAIQEWKQGKEVCFRYQFSLYLQSGLEGGGDTFCNGFLGEVTGVPFSGWRYIMG